MPCCGRMIHNLCWRDTAKGKCSLTWLCCCLCKGDIEPLGCHLDAYEYTVEQQTKCCEADTHRICLQCHLDRLTSSVPYLFLSPNGRWNHLTRRFPREHFWSEKAGRVEPGEKGKWTHILGLPAKARLGKGLSRSIICDRPWENHAYLG